MLKIVSATWGFHNHLIDVTDYFNSKISNDKFEINVTYKSFPIDPCKGIVKEIDIKYKYRGRVRHLIVQEPIGNNTRTFVINDGLPDTINTIGGNTYGIIEIKRVGNK